MPSPATRPGARPRQFLALVNDRLSPPARKRLAEILSAYVIGPPTGPRYRVGPIMKESWEAEDGIPEALAAEVAGLLAHLLEDGNIGGYASPTCCPDHRDLAGTAFPHRAAYPPDEELLGLAMKLIWTLLPRLRGVLDMRATGSRRVRMSRFMVLEAFLDRHHGEVISRAMDRADAANALRRMFDARRPAALRRFDLRACLRGRDIVGLLGARVDIPPDGTTRPHYCPASWVFSALGLPKATDRSRPPDEVLAKLGLQFDAGQTYVELAYVVRLETAPTSAGISPRPMAPTVIDSVGYWLFTPQRRSIGRNSPTWNFTRDIAKEGWGRAELISPVVPVGSLTDVIVWPRPTAADWSASATHALSTALRVP